jgi:hypothetical protein
MKTTIGNYDVYFWNKLSETGHSGWVVAKRNPSGGLGEVISKHDLKRDAVAAAKRYQAGDDRRARRWRFRLPTALS